ncbi:MAG: peptidoglycan DD-metalloendopeptidase family protein [Chitinophagaceae bacterium]
MLKKLVSCYVALVFCCSLAMAQQNSDDLKKKQVEIQREIDDLRKTLEETKQNKKAGLGQLAMIQRKLRLREQVIGNINEQMDVIEGNISQSRNEVTRLTRELDTLKSQYEKSVVYAYKNRSNYDFLNFIFSANGFNDALKRIEYLKSYRLYREQQAENIKNTQEILKGKITGLQTSREEKGKILKEKEKERGVLVEEKKEQDDFVGKLKSREKEINRELTSKQKADKKLRDGILVAIRREAEKAKAAAAAAAEAARKKEKEEAAAAAATAAKNNAAANNSNNTAATTTPAATAPVATKPAAPAKTKSVFEATPEGELLSDNFEKNKGKLPWPLEKGEIKLHYGLYSVAGTSIRGNNPGLTIETEKGAPVKAVFDGEVISVFDVEDNAAVLVQHGKFFTSYGGLSSASVSKGQKIKAGQVVGKAGTNDDGNGEIEFILMQDTRNLDPEIWIRRR